MKIDIDHYKICHVNNYSIQKKKLIIFYEEFNSYCEEVYK